MNHRQASPLLPFYANGTLPAAERAAVASHLAACAACRGELATLEEVAAAVEEVGGDEPRPAANLLARTLAKVEAYERGKPLAARRSPWGAGAWAARWAAVWKDFWQPLALPARGLIAAQAAALVLLGAVVLTGGRAPWSTLSGPGTATPTGARARLTLALAPEAPAGRVQGLLREVGARIVDGPSSAGFFTVELGAPAANTVAIEAVLGRLRAQPDLIRFAESSSVRVPP